MQIKSVNLFIIITGDKMREIDLSKFDLRTDLIIDNFISEENLQKIDYRKSEITKDIILEEIKLNKETATLCNKLPGLYKSISFKDITDHHNFKEVEKIVTDTLIKFLEEIKIKQDSSCLLIGLGNVKSTPDALGPKTVEGIIVTHHILNIGPLEEGYRDISILIPGVTGTTGIETKDIILGVVEKVKPDFLITIDALKTSSTSRINKTIQITNTGIAPGSGVNNTRVALNEETLNIPVLSIGIPTIIDSSTIVIDTLNYLLKKLSYDKDNIGNYKNKIAITKEYENYQKELTKQEKEKILGIIGTLDNESLKKLIDEVLNPLDYNLMVTPKEIDFLIDKLAKLLSNSLNNSLHKIKRQN